MAFSFGKRYNIKKFDIDTTNFDYYSLKELYDLIDCDSDMVFRIRGIWINRKGPINSKNPAPVIATDEFYVNLPSHLTPICEEMRADTDTIDAINKGTCGFTIYTYEHPDYSETFYSVRWADVPVDYVSMNLPKK